MTNKLFYDDGGKAQTDELPVLFLHSLAGASHHWQVQLDRVRKTQRALAFDLRGHGRSAEHSSFTLAEMATDVAETLTQLGIERVTLIGHSMGGAVAMKFVGMFPSRVAGLMLVDAAGDSTQIPQDQLEGMLAALDSPAYSSVIEHYWADLLVNSAEPTRTQLLTELANTPQSTVVAIFNELVQYNSLLDIAAFDSPIQLLSTPLSDAPFALHVLRPDIPHSRIEGTSHWIHLDNSAEFNIHLTNFVTKINQLAHA